MTDPRTGVQIQAHPSTPGLSDPKPAPHPIAHKTAICCWCKGPMLLWEGVYWCGQPACRQRQLAYAMRLVKKASARDKKKGVPDKVTWVYVPTPKQVEWEACKRPRPSDGSAFNVLGGGAAGPGKSTSARRSMLRRALAYPGYEGLLLRNTFPELEKTHLRRFESEVRQLKEAGASIEFVPSARVVRCGNGSIIECGHMEDVARYLSTEYDDIVPDEAATMDPEALMQIATRARSTKPNIIAAGGPWFRPVTNPGGPAWQLLLDLFIDHAPNYEDFPQLRQFYKPDMWVFVQALLEDNPYLGEGYEATLAVLGETRYRQLRFGDLRVWAGQFFTQWRQALHVRELRFEPGSLQWVRAMDWGRSSPGCIGWFACLPDGHYHCAAEFKFMDLDIDQVADAIRAIDLELGATQIRATIADPALFNGGDRPGESIAETFQRNRIVLTRGNNNRMHGWTRMREMLRNDPQGVPWLTFAPRCVYLIRTLPKQQQDAHNPEDIDTTGDDHGADCTRYFCMSRPSPTKFQAPALPENSVGAFAQSLRDAIAS